MTLRGAVRILRGLAPPSTLTLANGFATNAADFPATNTQNNGVLSRSIGLTKAGHSAGVATGKLLARLPGAPTPGSRVLFVRHPAPRT